MQPLRQFILFAQNTKVVVHMELYESRMCLERLAASFFPMFEDGGHCSSFASQQEAHGGSWTLY